MLRMVPASNGTFYRSSFGGRSGVAGLSLPARSLHSSGGSTPSLRPTLGVSVDRLFFAMISSHQPKPSLYLELSLSSEACNRCTARLT